MVAVYPVSGLLRAFLDLILTNPEHRRRTGICARTYPSNFPTQNFLSHAISSDQLNKSPALQHLHTWEGVSPSALHDVVMHVTNMADRILLLTGIPTRSLCLLTIVSRSATRMVPVGPSIAKWGHSPAATAALKPHRMS